MCEILPNHQTNGKASLPDGKPRGWEEIKGLAADMGLPVTHLLALSRQNDPFFCGMPAQRREAKWFAGLWKRFSFPQGVHLRRIHYSLVSQDKPVHMADGSPYENTQECWSALSEASKYARHLRLVDVTAFTDHRNPEPHVFADYERPFDYSDGPAWDVESLDDEPTWDWPTIPTDFPAPTFELPEVTVTGYDYHASNQPFHLELWIEKSTMNDVLMPVCRRLGINLVTGVGFQSITSVVQLLKRIRCLPDDKPSRVWYVSDFDPAGDHMPVAVARQIEFYLDRLAPGADIKLTPLALTREQVVQYKLPRIPIKREDRRKGDFEDRRGKGAVELDALEALYPGELARLVEEAAEPYRHDTLEDRLSEAEEEAAEKAGDEWQEATAEQRAELDRLGEEVEEVTERYRQRLTELSDQLQADLAPLRERADAAWRAAREIVTGLQIDLPDRPGDETGPPDEDDWLYDSGREYVEQIECYQRYKGGKRLDDRRQACPVCATEFTPLRRNGRYCSDRCRVAASRARKAEAGGAHG
jgi:hypothetical protein